ncbi:hypothetical protein [Nocardia amamiensis]|uniref:hypothetical protein n=1 Tax=Nocardia TaxID=1817 RepID=UPI0033F16D10
MAIEYNLQGTGGEGNVLALAVAVALTSLGAGGWSVDAQRVHRARVIGDTQIPPGARESTER